jgi:hypothetical protein
MREPNLIMNWPAILVAWLVAFVIGGLWYGPLFGSPWAKAMGMDFDCKPDRKIMLRSMGLQMLGLFFTTYVLALTLQLWRPSVWGLEGDGSSLAYGFCGAVLTWIGFYIPLQFGKIAWENRPWKLFFINAGHDFVTLLSISMILANWR